MKSMEENAVRHADNGLALAALSHDLRTPVTSMIALTQLALEAQRQGQGVEGCLMQILAAARTLEAITGDLTAAQARAERTERVPGAALAAALEAVVLPQAERKGQHLCIDMGELAGETMLCDRAGLARALLNLLTNAVKYTPEGGHIRLTARVQEGAGPMEMTAVFAVEDDGMGMKPEFLERMYEPHTRAQESAALPGTGMGLTIVRTLVTRMGGTIEVRSRWGEGTCFTVRVPMRREGEAVHGQEATVLMPLHPDAKRRQNGLLDGLHILLAEDNDLCAGIAVCLMEREGASVQRAANGREAASMFARSVPGGFDAIVMDMRMPEMDGCDAARAVRAMDRPDAETVPIVCLTAGTDAADMQQARQAGMDACLRKPLETHALAQALSAQARQEDDERDCG